MLQFILGIFLYSMGRVPCRKDALLFCRDHNAKSIGCIRDIKSSSWNSKQSCAFMNSFQLIYLIRVRYYCYLLMSLCCCWCVCLWLFRNPMCASRHPCVLHGDWTTWYSWTDNDDLHTWPHMELSNKPVYSPGTHYAAIAIGYVN